MAKQYFTNERSSFVKDCFCHEKIKFISSSRRVVFILLYRQKDFDKIIDVYSSKRKFRREITEITSSSINSLVKLWKINHSGPGCSFYEFYEWYIFKGPFWGAYFWKGSSAEGNLCFKIDWASLIVASKFTVFALFYFVFEGAI